MTKTGGQAAAPLGVPEGYAIVPCGSERGRTLFSARVILPTGGYRELSQDGRCVAVEHDIHVLLELVTEHQRRARGAAPHRAGAPYAAPSIGEALLP